ncbi:hypothetical protein [Benzoatithermus flavus]|uniref:HNH endonuclease n=1 Tax=Benzoatithermus flavus TaxID=3108223 RepID=A0ABU8XV97_9PROT
MPIRRELRWFYPIDWPQISREIRFGRARGRCESCGRPHGQLVIQLDDGRWFDEAARCWRDDAGRPAAWPDIVEFTAAVKRRIVLGTAHLDHDPQNSAVRNLRALCQRCHLRHDRDEHRRRRRLTWLRRRALGDLFLGPYRLW